MAGTEDLVPAKKKLPDNTWVRDTIEVEDGAETYAVVRYRPRIEGGMS